jgi:Protein of unknown function (DUF3352)
MRRSIGIVAVLAAIAVAGCGSDKAGSPEELTPASSLIYAQATLKPEGDQKQGVDALLKKLPGDPRQSAQDLVRRLFRQSSSGLSYEKDVKPWLGDQAAFFASAPRSSNAGDLEGALLVATEDEDKAKEAALKTVKGKRSEGSYKDVDYTKAEQGAIATVDGYLVIGTVAGFKRAVDVSKGDAGKLSDSKAFKNALDDAPEDRLATFFVNSPQLLPSLRRTLGSAASGPFEKLLNEAYVTTVQADAGGVDLSTTIPPSVSTFFLPLLGSGSELIKQLPGDSWLAGAQPEFGKTLNRYVDLFAQAVGGRALIDQQVRSQTGLDLNRDVIGWMGDVGYFVRGTSASSVNGALEIETSDPAASRRALRALRGLLSSGNTRVGKLTAPGGGFGYTLHDPTSPKPIHVFQRGGSVVLAYGDEAAADAVKAGDKLGDSQDFKTSSDALGGDYAVSTYVLVKPIVELVDSAASGSDPGWREAKPYVEAFQSVVAGSRKKGDSTESRVRAVVP